jgi:hypothetical protein
MLGPYKTNVPAHKPLLVKKELSITGLTAQPVVNETEASQRTSTD